MTPSTTARRALVCLPTYDERENVEPITRAILAATPDVDVLVIDDSSPDGTGQLADAIAARDADLVLGSRYVRGGGTVHWGIGRKVLSRGGSLYARTVLGLGVRDLTGGFKCFRREVLEAIDLGSVRSEGYSFQIELTYRAARKGFRVAEVPIVFVDRRHGASKMSRRIVREAIGMVWKLRFDALSGKL